MNDSKSKTLVTVEEVHKKFLHEGREVHILKGIDLVIERGEMLSVVGPSGAGKSTLLHILGTLDVPTSGRILYDDQDVTRYSPSRLAGFRNYSLGFVFQSHHLLPEFTAIENVMMPGMIRGEESGTLHKNAKALLDEVGLGHRLSHRPGELSGGEQARVALARALLMKPILVLADEPTGNLDSKTSDAIHTLFFELNRSRGTTFLIVTHNNELADSMPRKVSMRDGRIESDVTQEGRGRQEVGPARDAPSTAPDEDPPPPAHREQSGTRSDLPLPLPLAGGRSSPESPPAAPAASGRGVALVRSRAPSAIQATREQNEPNEDPGIGGDPEHVLDHPEPRG